MASEWLGITRPRGRDEPQEEELGGGHLEFIFKMKHLGWGDGSVGKALAMQGKNLTSNSQNSDKASVAVSICDPSAPVEGIPKSS